MVNDKDDTVRITAIAVLGKLGEQGDEKSIEKLLTLLKNKSCDVRAMAAREFKNIKEVNAVNSLIDTLKDQEHTVRTAVVETLGEIGDRTAVKPLIAAIKDEHPQVRLSAVEALGKIGDSEAIDPIVIAMQDDFLSKAAANALDRLGWKPSRDENGSRYWVIKKQWDKCVGKHAIKPLLDKLVKSDWYDRKRISDALYRVGWRPEKNEMGAWYYIGMEDIHSCVKIGEPAIRPLIHLIMNFDEPKPLRFEAYEALIKAGVFTENELEELIKRNKLTNH